MVDSTVESIKQLPSSNLPLPTVFLEFLQKNCIDPSLYDLHDSIPRYIRIKRGNESYLQKIEAELKCNLQAVSWLPGFFAIPSYIHIASLSIYREGKIYGMDAASGAAVLALNVLPGDHVLDLCAAPGAKLCMLSDMLGDTGSLTGVDISRQRLAACRTMLQKYALGDHCRLFVADGTSFSLLPLRKNLNAKLCSGSEKSEYNQYVFKEWSSRRRWIERKNAKKTSIISGTSEPELIFYGRYSGIIGLSKCEIFDKRFEHENSDFGYDKVLVDAECTHDGSIKHVQKFEHWGWETLQRRLLDAQRMDNLMHLQLQLLTNGFKLLKDGGTLVYSTCSLTTAQNESILEQFLLKNKHAGLVEIDLAKDWPCKSGRIPKTLRFDPCTSKTSGLFVAKLVKRSKYENK
ncbi:putative Ribosomal RNA small subunit methyltransferase [Zostera marina]|uniref:Putative Ribosomal RNA small subunit methyltransferase n=1 Tax=Zostera marina TaxID=29655 RepID=A0A0K9P9Q6_ZOSMR|nr:putative Ribosomal RNA small subunit methyltransferase [Zostera marina]